MDKIFKNDTIMGIVAIATLALTVTMFLKSRKSNTGTLAPEGKE